MTWAEYKALLIERVKFDFDVKFDVSQTAETDLGSTFDTRAAQHLRLFTREAMNLYCMRAALDLSAMDGEFRLKLSEVAAKPVFEPTRIWIHGNVLGQMKAEDITNAMALDPAEGDPSRFALIGPYDIVLNARITATCAAATNHAVDGWYTEPTPTDDDNDVETDDEHLEVASLFSAVRMCEDVVTGEEGKARLSYQMSRANREVKRIRAEMLERMYRTHGYA